MLTKTVDIKTGRADLEDLLILVQAGDEVLLVDGDTPLARLVPVESSTKSRIVGLHVGMIAVSDDFDEPLPDEFWLGGE